MLEKPIMLELENLADPITLDPALASMPSPTAGYAALNQSDNLLRGLSVPTVGHQICRTRQQHTRVSYHSSNIHRAYHLLLLLYPILPHLLLTQRLHPPQQPQVPTPTFQTLPNTRLQDLRVLYPPQQHTLPTTKIPSLIHLEPLLPLTFHINKHLPHQPHQTLWTHPTQMS